MTRPKQRRAFSLIEIMITMTILGVLISFSAPRVMRTMEQSHADIATANLRSICSAQRFYWIENRTYASSLVTLVDEGLLDNVFLNTMPRYQEKSFSFRTQVTHIQPRSMVVSSQLWMDGALPS